LYFRISLLCYYGILSGNYLIQIRLPIVFIFVYCTEEKNKNLNKKENVMSKGLVTKKSTKKEATKTMKEKKAAKRDKKNEKNNSGYLSK
jgi:hypothetical protein